MKLSELELPEYRKEEIRYLCQIMNAQSLIVVDYEFKNIKKIKNK